MSSLEIERVMCTYQREIDRLNEKIEKLKNANDLLNNENVMWRTKFVAEGAAKCILEEETIGPFEAPPKCIELKLED